MAQGCADPTELEGSTTVSSGGGTCATSAAISTKVAANSQLPDAHLHWKERLQSHLRREKRLGSGSYQKATKIVQGGEKLLVVEKRSCKATRRVKALEVSQSLSVSEIESLIEDLDQNRGCIESVEVNGVLRHASFNDTRASQQLHLNSISFTSGYENFTRVPASTTSIVAIIDSGISGTHEDLTAQLWRNTAEYSGTSGVDNDGNGYVDDIRGYNFANGSGDPSPRAWSGEFAGGEIHGTHVAGLAGASSNNGLGVVGSGGNDIRLMDLNIFGDSPRADLNRAIEAIEYAVDKNADVINLSIVTSAPYNALNVAISDAVRAGVVVVAAAGNEAANLDLTENTIYPAKQGATLPGLITVGATYADSKRVTVYSNYSPTFVELMAPGSNTFNASASRRGLWSTIGPGNSTYFQMEGTSMATPLVAGAAGLLINYLKANSLPYSPADIERYLVNSADSSSSLSGYARCGGHLNVLSLYNVAREL